MGGGSPGGAATAAASAIVTTQGASASATATAFGGNGGDGSSSGFAGGTGPGATGAGATGTASTHALAGGATSSFAATGGNGGNGLSGATPGDGGAITLGNAVDGSAQGGALTLKQTAVGGSGGTSSSTTAGGTGGGATSTLAFADRSASSLSLTVNATGGNGGANFLGGAPGVGGNATAQATLSASAPATVTAVATGGSVGAVTGGINIVRAPGKAPVAGSANATASINNVSGNQTVATATATGSSGLAQADASSKAGIISQLHTIVTAPVATTASEQSQSSVGGVAPAYNLVAGYQAAAFATGLPSTADVNTALGSSSNVRSAITALNVFGLVETGAAAPTGISGMQTFTASTDIHFLPGSLAAGQHLQLGLLNPSLVGGGFQSMKFEVDEQGSPIITQTFTDAATATAYFTDHALDLGAPTATGSTGTDITIDYSVTSSSNQTFQSELVIAGVPQPATAVSLLLGASLLGVRRMRRVRT